MTDNQKEFPRTLAISPSTRGFGFAVLEDAATLVNWDNKSAKGDDKNAQCLKKIEKLIVEYKPEVIVLENCSVKSCRRHVRIRMLIQAIADLAPAHGMSVMLFSKEQVKQVFLTQGKGTKHDVAKILAKRFPEELEHKLPPKRREWENENSQMDIFDAVALALCLQHQ